MSLLRQLVIRYWDSWWCHWDRWWSPYWDDCVIIETAADVLIETDGGVLIETAGDSLLSQLVMSLRQLMKSLLRQLVMSLLRQLVIRYWDIVRVIETAGDVLRQLATVNFMCQCWVMQPVNHWLTYFSSLDTYWFTEFWQNAFLAKSHCIIYYFFHVKCSISHVELVSFRLTNFCMYNMYWFFINTPSYILLSHTLSTLYVFFISL